MFYGRHSDRFQGPHWGLLILFVIFLGLVGLAVYLLLRRRPGATMMVGGPPPSGPPTGARPPGFGPDPAIDQVRYRYARGELSREEYFQLVGDLGAGVGGPASVPPVPPAPPTPAAPPAPGAAPAPPTAAAPPAPPWPPAPPGAGGVPPPPPIA